MSGGTLFTNGRFPAEGGIQTISNNAHLSVTTGKVLIECPVCGLHVLKPAAWVRRPGRSNFFCGKACSDEFKRVRVKTKCVICEKDFYVIPSYLNRLVCCSHECSTERKSIQTLANPVPNRKPPPVKNRSSGNGRAKLTQKDVDEISKSNELTHVLAKRFLVSKTTIQKFRKAYREQENAD